MCDVFTGFFFAASTTSIWNPAALQKSFLLLLSVANFLLFLGQIIVLINVYSMWLRQFNNNSCVLLNALVLSILFITQTHCMHSKLLVILLHSNGINIRTLNEKPKINRNYFHLLFHSIYSFIMYFTYDQLAWS